MVLAGGLSPEREVSLRSGRRVRDALEEAGVDARLADADAGLIPALLADPPTAVFPAIHGSYGEDGAIREILALVGVPYVGSVASACRGAFDKPTAKALVAAAGIATPESVTLPREIFHDLGATAVIDRVIAKLGLPLFVKPARGGSSLGAGPVRTASELPTAIVSCFAYGDTALIERFIGGTEIAVSVVDLGDGPSALPAVEIVPAAGQYDYTARYTAGQTAFYTPARLPGRRLGRGREGGGVRACRPGAPRHLPHRSHRQRVRRGVLPRSQRFSGHDRDQHAADGPGRRRARVRRGVPDPAAPGGRTRELIRGRPSQLALSARPLSSPSQPPSQLAPSARPLSSPPQLAPSLSLPLPMRPVRPAHRLVGMAEHKSFGSDNHAGAHEAVLRAVLEANDGDAVAYGADDWTRRATAELRRAFRRGR